MRDADDHNWRGFETRTWKSHGVTHAVHQRVRDVMPYDNYSAHTSTNCGQVKPNLPWRNTQRFSLEKVNCIACIAEMAV